MSKVEENKVKNNTPKKIPKTSPNKNEKDTKSPVKNIKSPARVNNKENTKLMKTPEKNVKKYEENSAQKKKEETKSTTPNKKTNEKEVIDVDTKGDVKSIEKNIKKRPRPEGNHYPIRRIRTVMNAAYSGNVSGDAVQLVAKAAECFTKQLVNGAYKEAIRTKKKKIDYASLASYANSEEQEEQLMFLQFLIPHKVTVKEYKKQYMKQNQNQSSDDIDEEDTEEESEETEEEEEDEEGESNEKVEEVITLD